MSSRIATTQNFRDSAGRSKADARALILQSLAGRARIAAELIMGRSIVDGEDAAVPRNPNGDIGVNMSCPPWGSAWLAPHGGAGGIKPDTGNWIGQRRLGEVVTDKPFELKIRYYMQPFDLAPLVPWSRLRPIIRAYTASGGPISIDVTCTRADNEERTRTATFSVTNTNEQTLEDADLFWDVRPGMNRFLLRVSSASATLVYFSGLSLDNVAKRSH